MQCQRGKIRIYQYLGNWLLFNGLEPNTVVGNDSIAEIVRHLIYEDTHDSRLRL